MPTFDTPEPILVTLELNVGDIRVVASERRDTVVEVRPTNSAKKSDVAAAEQTRIEYSGGRLVIRAPKSWRQYSFFSGGESIDVQIALPAQSILQARASVAALRCDGPLGECRYKTSVGDISIEQMGSGMLSTGGGDVTVDRALGSIEIRTGTGSVRLGSVDGAAVIKNSNGDTWIGEVTRDVRVNAANGTISIDRALATVAAKTANGDVRLGEVASGVVVVQTACGKLDIGIRTGVAAWLDLNTQYGDVRNRLDDADRPAPGESAVEVRARTAYGDITVRRSLASDRMEVGA